jgi:catalase
MRQPSTAWQERIAPDEEAHLKRVAEVIGNLQRNRSAKYGQGRALHRKQLLATTGTLEVLDGLPEPARHGLFATPGSHRVLARFSNGGPEVQSDRIPDIRGFALKIFDVGGPSALGGTTDHQDFLMINQNRLPTRDSREFIEFMAAATRGQASGLLHLFKAHGLGGGWTRLRELFAAVGRKFNGFAAERFNTAAPLCCGPYAVKVRLKPVGNPPPSARSKDIVADLSERLATGPVQWDMELQFFVDEAVTPIEDASKVWPESETPIVTVARLSLFAASEAAAQQAEAAKFDPWSGLAAHRPLGEIMRARKAAYYTSQQGRAAA